MLSQDASNWSLFNGIYEASDPAKRKMLDEFFQIEGRKTWDAEFGRLLLKLNYANRPIIRREIERLKTDFRNGNCNPGNDMVVFDEFRRLRNGQNRITAQDETGSNVTFYVRLNVPESEFPTIDKGESRSNKDSLNLIPGFVEEFGRSINNDATIVKHIISEGASNMTALRGVSIYVEQRLLLHFREELDWINETIGSKKVSRITTNSAVLAVFCRAKKFGEDNDALTYAINYLIDGGLAVEHREVERRPGTDSLKALRQSLLGIQKYTSSKAYWTTENMLKCFLVGTERKSCSEASRENWPLNLDTIMPAEPQINVQIATFGREMMDRLVAHAIAWQVGTEKKKKEIIDVMVGPSGNSSLRGTLSKNIKKMIEQFSGIEIPGKGELILSPNNVSERQSLFILRK